MNFKQFTKSDGQQVMMLVGEFDAAGAVKVRDVFEEIAICQKGDLILDIEAVEFLDSSGVGALVFLYKRLKTKGRILTISGASGQPAQLLKLLRIDQVIAVNHSSVDRFYDSIQAVTAGG